MTYRKGIVPLSVEDLTRFLDQELLRVENAISQGDLSLNPVRKESFYIVGNGNNTSLARNASASTSIAFSVPGDAKYPQRLTVGMSLRHVGSVTGDAYVNLRLSVLQRGYYGITTYAPGDSVQEFTATFSAGLGFSPVKVEKTLTSTVTGQCLLYVTIDRLNGDTLSAALTVNGVFLSYESDKHGT